MPATSNEFAQLDDSDIVGVHERSDLAFPTSLAQFQRLFPDDSACATYLEGAKWPKGFECPHCREKGEPFRMATRTSVLTCRKCRKQTSLTVGTVMARTHSPLTTWFWGAYLVATMTPGISAVQFERQLGLTRETAFQILHKLRAGMVRQNRNRIGGNLARGDHVEVDQTCIGGTLRGKVRDVKDQTLVVAAVEVLQRKPNENVAVRRRSRRHAGRLRMEVVQNRDRTTLYSFVEAAVDPRAVVVTDDCPGYAALAERGYQHRVVVEDGETEAAEDYLSMVRLVFLNLKSWLSGTHHGVSSKHLQAYLNEFAFRFNRRLAPFSAFRSLLGNGASTESPTYDALYSGEWKHPRISK
jgi:transposase-like protein